MNFSERSRAINRPGLAAGLSGLLGAETAEPERIRTWLPGWHAAMQSLEGGPDTPVRLSPARFPYYERAVEAILSSDHPQAALWPLLRTWTLACTHLAANSPHLSAWLEACDHLHLGPDLLAEKLSALDAYLDNIEELLKSGEMKMGSSHKPSASMVLEYTPTFTLTICQIAIPKNRFFPAICG